MKSAGLDEEAELEVVEDEVVEQPGDPLHDQDQGEEEEHPGDDPDAEPRTSSGIFSETSVLASSISSRDEGRGARRGVGHQLADRLVAAVQGEVWRRFRP